MIFNSLTFLVFLIASIVLYWTLGQRLRIYFLCAASIVFYGFWDFRFVPLLLFSVIVDYAAGRALSVLPDGRRRTMTMVAAVSANIAVLLFFKYLYFFADQLNGLAYLIGTDVTESPYSLPIQIILPLGISFYTFQSMSYTIDVWRRNISAERDFALFCAYVIYFPQLVAGPILRAGEVIWQLNKRPAFCWTHLSEGLERVMIGLFFKVVLADNLATFVDTGFAIPADRIGAVDVLTLSFLFGFQIYFDFAGYSHIAIGTARMMGIHFPENFNFPYLASSPRDFWRRWHISLSSWIRDYLYLPLCGATAGRQSVHGLDVAGRTGSDSVRRAGALWLTWIIMGLWHGANWTFAVWGLWHAALITIHRVLARLSFVKAPKPVTWALTLPFVMLGWIPFRANDLDQTLSMWSRLLSLEYWLKPSSSGGNFPFWMSLHRDSYYFAVAVLMGILTTWLVRTYVVPKLDKERTAYQVASAILIAVLAPIVYAFLRPTAQFIYFQF